MRASEGQDVVVIGGGVVGLCTALLLARDGCRVRVLERDPAPPPGDPAEAWTGWQRRGVSQFRLLHSFLPRFRALLDAELPGVSDALVADGALRTNRLLSLPDSVTGGARPSDGRFDQVTGRRPVIEATLARLAAAEPGVEVRRGLAVEGLITADRPVDGIPHVAGVVTADGEELRADLVVDASGRRSPMPAWLAAIGVEAEVETREEVGFVYYCRHFRSTDGAMPPSFGPPLQHYESISLVMLPADHGTWGVGMVASGRDATMRAARDPDTWHRIVKSYPLVAHWLEGDPITGVDVMAGIPDVFRTYWTDGRPVATGVVAVGDAWACTNPSLGRGASIGLRHAVALRDVLREVSPDDPRQLAACFAAATRTAVEPLLRDTLAFDRHRLAEIEAEVDGRRYETEDVGWNLGLALRAGAGRDPDLLRAAAAIGSLLERGVDVLADPGIRAKVMAVGEPGPAPGPSRAALLGLAAA